MERYSLVQNIIVILMWKIVWLRGISRGTNSSFWIKWVGLPVEHLLLIGLCMWLNKTRNDTSGNRCDLLVNVCCTNQVCICMCMLCKRLCLRSICLLGNLGFGGLQKVVRLGPYSKRFNYLSFPFADEFFKLFPVVLRYRWDFFFARDL